MQTLDRQLARRLTLRLIPFFCLLSFFASLDRSNVSFAALQMNKDLGFGPEVYGFGASLFFLPYALTAIPSNLALDRWGARRWLPVLLMSWGLISAGMAFIQGSGSFYFLRFLLGVAEGGFNPAMYLLLRSWFPDQHRATAVSQLFWAQILTLAFGAPLSGLFLSMGGVLGLAGWQIMFLLEGLPAVALGIAVYFYLDDKVEDASWLSREEKSRLSQALKASEDARRKAGSFESIGKALASPVLWGLALFYVAISPGFYGLNLWLPQMIKQMSDLSDFQVTVASGLPHALGFIGVYLLGRYADKTGRRRFVLAGCMLLAAFGSLLGAFGPTTGIKYVGFCCSAIGTWGVVGAFWAMATGLLQRAAAAAGIAVINTAGSLIGSFPAPFLVGWIKQETGSFSGALAMFAVFQLLAAVIALLLPKSSDSLPAGAVAARAG